MSDAIFILGMHRSGTSALARVLNLLGVSLGTRLMPAAEDNEKGFWEHEGVVEDHEALLKALGHAWDDGFPLPEGWQESAVAKRTAAELESLIDTEFADAPLWGVKDPRQSLLFPLWEPLLRRNGAAARVIVAYRHPMQVAASLASRDQMGTETALLCWLAYTLESMTAALPYPHVIVDYDRLMADWRGCVADIARGLQIDWPVPPDAAAGEIEAFLEPGLRHHKANASIPETPVGQMVTRCLALMQEPIDPAALESLRADWRAYGAALHAPLREARLANWYWEVSAEAETERAERLNHRAQDVSKQMDQLRQTYEQRVAELKELDQLRHERDAAQIALARLQQSTSWKLTAPLRRLKGTA